MKKLTTGMVLIIAVILAIFTTGMALPPTLDVAVSASSAYLVDYDSGSVLYEKNADEKKPIASMVKIMTLLLTFEAMDSGKLKANDMITISHESASQVGSELFIDENAQYSVSDLIKGIVVVSANDASVAIAETLCGSESAFVTRMNERAGELGMTNTLFANSTGYPTASEQYSTAHDVSIMTRALLVHSQYYDYSKIWLEDYTHPSGRITQLANTNKLIRHYKGCDSGKTGYTDSAKFCLSASACRDGMRVVATTLGACESKARFRDVSTLFNYAFNNYKRKVLVEKDTAIDKPIEIKKAKIKDIYPVAQRPITALIGRDNKEWHVECEYLESLSAPICKGETLGYAFVVVDGKRISSVPLVAGSDIDKATFWDYVRRLTEKN